MFKHHKYRRGISIIEVIVIIIVISVIGFLLIFKIDMDTGGGRGGKTQDVSNLKNLVGIYMSGQSVGKPVPQSTGHRFWLAMFVGDPATWKGGLKPDETYAQITQAGNLLCPIDYDRLEKAEIMNEFDDLLFNRSGGWDKLSRKDNLYCSYAGPRNPNIFTDKSAGIVGCTGSRDGLGFYTDGFSTVNSMQGAEFKLYEELAERFYDDWTGEEEEPNWNSTLLKHVLNIEPSSQSKLQTKK